MGMTAIWCAMHATVFRVLNHESLKMEMTKALVKMVNHAPLESTSPVEVTILSIHLAFAFLSHLLFRR